MRTFIEHAFHLWNAGTAGALRCGTVGVDFFDETLLELERLGVPGTVGVDFWLLTLLLERLECVRVLCMSEFEMFYLF